MGFKKPGEDGIAWNIPLVIHLHLTVSLSDLDHVAYLSGRPAPVQRTGPSDLDHVAYLSGRLSPVQRVLLLVSLPLFQKLHRELLGALAVLHAGVIGIEGTAGTVGDTLDDDGLQSWISLDVRNLDRDERIDLVTGILFVIQTNR